MNVMSIFFCQALLGVTAVSAANAQPYFPSGSCAVVVAARPSAQEARRYIWHNGWQDTARVFESTNGWFAITVGVIPNDGSTNQITRLKSRGIVPSDAYCTVGWAYVREVVWRADNRSQVQPEERPRRGSTGTAFYVTPDGVALTNAHVIDGCAAITLDGMPAAVVAQSSVFDLAAIRLASPTETEPLSFATGDASLNADITIAGYPLHGLLGGVNVSRGSISSLKGLHGDETSIQISAPVQPGNSGGPAIDRFGGVVGVVVSKLNTVALANAIGDIAQNVNFAIRGSVAKIFLSSNGIAYVEATQGEPLGPEKSADLLTKSTRLVECN
jgi:S1-C subfamily serine protease